MTTKGGRVAKKTAFGIGAEIAVETTHCDVLETAEPGTPLLHDDH